MYCIELYGARAIAEGFIEKNLCGSFASLRLSLRYILFLAVLEMC